MIPSNWLRPSLLPGVTFLTAVAINAASVSIRNWRNTRLLVKKWSNPPQSSVYTPEELLRSTIFYLAAALSGVKLYRTLGGLKDFADAQRYSDPPPESPSKPGPHIKDKPCVIEVTRVPCRCGHVDYVEAGGGLVEKGWGEVEGANVCGKCRAKYKRQLGRANAKNR
jgi:hypothetical protein